jgi:hypothetical protein
VIAIWLYSVNLDRFPVASYFPGNEDQVHQAQEHAEVLRHLGHDATVTDSGIGSWDIAEPSPHSLEPRA